jgi:hypothetical protein
MINIEILKDIKDIVIKYNIITYVYINLFCIFAYMYNKILKKLII